MGRLPLLFCLLAPQATDLWAQTRLTPYAAAAIGVSELGSRAVVQTNPPTRTRTMANWFNVLVSGTVGLQISDRFGVDAVVRTTVGFTTPFRAVSAGPTVRLGPRVFVRGGVGRIRGSDSIICVGEGSSSCPERYIHEWTNGFDVSAGVDLWRTARWRIVPVAWWAQSTGSGTLYRSLGLGAQVRFR